MEDRRHRRDGRGHEAERRSRGEPEGDHQRRERREVPAQVARAPPWRVGSGAHDGSDPQWKTDVIDAMVVDMRRSAGPGESPRAIISDASGVRCRRRSLVLRLGAWALVLMTAQTLNGRPTSSTRWSW